MTRADAARDYLEQQASRHAGTAWGRLAARTLEGVTRRPALADGLHGLMADLDLVEGRTYGIVAVANRMRLADDEELLAQIRQLRADARQRGDQRLFDTCGRAVEDHSVRAIRACAKILAAPLTRHRLVERDRQRGLARTRRRVDTLLNQVEYEREHPA